MPFATIRTKIAQEFRDTVQFICHDDSTEAVIYRAIVVTFAVWGIGAIGIGILQALGIIHITYTGSTTALCQ